MGDVFRLRFGFSELGPHLHIIVGLLAEGKPGAQVLGLVANLEGWNFLHGLAVHLEKKGFLVGGLETAALHFGFSKAATGLVEVVIVQNVKVAGPVNLRIFLYGFSELGCFLNDAVGVLIHAASVINSIVVRVQLESVVHHIALDVCLFIDHLVVPELR